MDITQRCQQILNRVDFVVCEELKNGSKLLKRWKIEKELLELNEHNEILAAEKIVTKLKKKQTAALISDAGTPVFLDPGTFLLRLCYQNKIPITSVAGACSLSLALSLVPFEMSSFHFGGFLDRNSQKEIEVAFCNDIDLSNKKAFQDILENSLYSVLNEILQKKVPFDIPLPEEFYQDSEMVLKNRTSLKEKFSQFSDIKLDFYVQLGEMDITLGVPDLLDFKEGSILETEIAFSTSLNCYANKKLLGQGEIFDGYIAGFKLQSFSNQ